MSSSGYYFEKITRIYKLILLHLCAQDLAYSQVLTENRETIINQ